MVRQHGENYAGVEESVDANVSNITASTSKNTQDNEVATKDFFQPQLGEVQGNHGIYSPFYCEGLEGLESDGLRDMVRKHGHFYRIAYFNL